MKTAILLGSPRKSGNSAFLANRLVDESNIQSVERIELYNFDIKPCTDCRKCKKAPFLCTVNDGMPKIYQKLEASDLLIFATPIYWYSPTAQMKLLIDRFRPYYANKKISGKKAVLIMAAGVGESDCDLTISLFKRMCNALGIELVSTISSESYDVGDAEKDDSALSQISTLAEKLKEIN